MDIANLAYEVVNEASAVLKNLFFDEDVKVEVGLNYTGDSSLAIDLLVEKLIIDKLRSTGMKLHIVSEESGVIKCSEPDYIVLIDPLDGSLNYLIHHPFVAVSLVFYDPSRPFTDRPCAGALSNVFLNEVYTIDEGSLYLNGKPLPNSKKRLNAVFSIYTETPLLIQKVKHTLENLYGVPYKVRTLGSAALESLYSLIGRIDLFIHNTGRLRNLDVAFSLGACSIYGLKPLDLHGNAVLLRVDEIVNIDSLMLGWVAEEVVKNIKVEKPSRSRT